MNSLASFVSADGSPLAIYLALPAGEAPLVVHRAIAPRSSILELGSGPGRLTRVLVALGHSVTAVDDSAEMLEHVTGAERVHGDVFALDLGRRFDVVLAASMLINRPGAEVRDRLLRVGRRHLRPTGAMLVERFAPGWLLDAPATENRAGPVHMSYTPGPLHGTVRSASMRYDLGDLSWKQDFDAEDVTDQVLGESARRAGLVISEVLDDDGSWVLLRPV